MSAESKAPPAAGQEAEEEEPLTYQELMTRKGELESPAVIFSARNWLDLIDKFVLVAEEEEASDRILDPAMEMCQCMFISRHGLCGSRAREEFMCPIVARLARVSLRALSFARAPASASPVSHLSLSALIGRGAKVSQATLRLSRCHFLKGTSRPPPTPTRPPFPLPLGPLSFIHTPLTASFCARATPSPRIRRCRRVHAVAQAAGGAGGRPAGR